MRLSAASLSSSVMRLRLTWRAMLPLMVASAFLEPGGRDVVQHHGNARERADMGDAVAHLPRADDADLANALRHDVSVA